MMHNFETPHVRQQLRFVNVWSLALAFAVFLTACGGGGGGASSEESLAVIAAAEANELQLKLTDVLVQTELLDAESGQITTLGDVVVGDRPVLLWYWSPN